MKTKKVGDIYVKFALNSFLFAYKIALMLQITEIREHGTQICEPAAKNRTHKNMAVLYTFMYVIIYFSNHTRVRVARIINKNMHELNN